MLGGVWLSWVCFLVVQNKFSSPRTTLDSGDVIQAGSSATSEWRNMLQSVGSVRWTVLAEHLQDVFAKGKSSFEIMLEFWG